MQQNSKETNHVNIEPRISFSSESNVLLIEIETEELYIRSYRNNDFEDCVALYGDEKLSKYFDHGQPRSRLEVEDLIADPRPSPLLYPPHPCQGNRLNR